MRAWPGLVATGARLIQLTRSHFIRVKHWIREPVVGINRLPV